MNLLEYSNRLSRGCNEKLISEQITVMNIINGIFSESDIVNIQSSEDKPTFIIVTKTSDIATIVENKLNNQIVPGAYKPFYKILVSRSENILNLFLIEV